MSDSELDPPLVYCEWLDAESWAEWRDDVPDCPMIRTIGWMVANDEAMVAIAGTLSDDGHSGIVIPKGCVKRLTTLTWKSRVEPGEGGEVN